jgi:TPR repeat protein
MEFMEFPAAWKRKRPRSAELRTLSGSALAELGWRYYAAEEGWMDDDAMAAKCWRWAATKGDARGQFFLGNCFECGFCGVEQDYAQAAILFQLSAEQGYVEAEKNLRQLLRDHPSLNVQLSGSGS